MTLKDFAQQMNGFERPVVTFKVNGSTVSGKSLLYRNVKVTLTAGFEASSCELEVAGQFSRFADGKLSMDAALSNFVLGAKLEALIGYGDSFTAKSVFVGYISAVEFELVKESTVLFVTAMDAKLFMMNSFRSERKKDIKKLSDAVADVLKKYSGVSDGTVIEASGETVAPIEQHNQSDYSFIVSLAKKLNYLFYVIDGKIHFTSHKKYTDSIVTVEPCLYLREFRREMTLANQVKKVQVRGYNVKDPMQPFEGIAERVSAIGGGSKAGNELTNLINDTMEKIVVDNSVQSAAEAKERAEALLGQMSMEFLSGEMELVGLPVMQPGHLFTMDGLTTDLNRTYFITQVIHEVSKDDFVTKVMFAGNKA